jgi:hypothetical protein
MARQPRARQCRHSALATSDADGFGKCYKRHRRKAIDQEWKPQCTGRCVFRVDKEFGEQRTRLTVSGEISSACIDVLETCCEQAIRDCKAVHLVLDITTIDGSGRALLRRLAAKGVRLSAKGIYHSYLVDTIRRADSKPAR